MQNSNLILFILLFFGLSLHGQDASFAAVGVHGCWVLEPNKKEYGLKNRVYRSCDTSETGYQFKNTKITFSAKGICEFEVAIQDALCPIQYQTIAGSWTYDTDSSILEIYYPEDFQKEFWGKVQEMYSDEEIPNPRLHKKFRILELDKNIMVVELVDKINNSVKNE